MAVLLTITSVTGTNPYQLTVVSSAGVVIGNYVSDGVGDLYRVINVPSGVLIDVQDDISPDAPEGSPSTGSGSAFTPTTYMQLSQPPFNTPAWDEIFRRDLRRIDSFMPRPSDAIPAPLTFPPVAGVSNDYSRSDHNHSHGNLAGGTLHTNATQTDNGYMSKEDKTILDNLLTISDEGSSGFTGIKQLKFVGSEIQAQQNPLDLTQAIISVTSSSTDGYGIEIKDEGISFGNKTKLNFVGGAIRAELDSYDGYQVNVSIIDNGLKTTIWVDQNSLALPSEQDGTVLRPFSTLTAAVNKANAGPQTAYHIVIAFGDYSGEAAISIPQNTNYIIEGPARRLEGVCTIGAFNWTVTGDRTSVLGFRNLGIKGTITVIDGYTPAVHAILSVASCQLGAVAGGTAVISTGTSFVSLTCNGASFGSVSTSISAAVTAAITGNIDLNPGIVLLEGVQCRSSCTLIRCGTLYASGCFFSQNIECGSTFAKFINCNWETPQNITFIGSAGITEMDAGSIYLFTPAGGDVINGDLTVTYQDIPSTGFVSGGVVTRTGGFNLNITAGSGYVLDITLNRITWNAASVVAPFNSAFVVYVDDAGIVHADNSYDHLMHIILARGYSNHTQIALLTSFRVRLEQFAARTSEYARTVVGPVLVGGLAATIYSPPSRQLTVENGSYYLDFDLLIATGASPIIFYSWRDDGYGGWIAASGNTLINNTQYDAYDGYGLIDMNAGQYRKDLLFVAVNDSGTDFHVVFGQHVFTSQSEAEAGIVPIPPSSLVGDALRIAGIVISKDGYIASTTDERPRLGQLATGSASVSDHGLLSGLSDNDHPHYQLRSEKGTTNGYASLDGYTHVPAIQLNLAITAPTNVTKAAASVGLSVEIARADHKHDISTAASAQGIGGGSSEGSATTIARSDHDHAIHETGGPTDLTVAAVAVNDLVGRVGTTLRGMSISGDQPIVAGLTINEDFQLAGDLTPATLDAYQNDYNPTGLATASVLRLNSNSDAYQITGLQGGADGRLMLVMNVGLAPILLMTESINSSAANRFSFATNREINPSAGILLCYDAVSLRWRSPSTIALSSVVPATTTKSAAVIGTSSMAARADHKHDVSTAAPTTNIGSNTINHDGYATTLSRSDHTHKVTLPATEASATGDTTTTSATDVALASMTLTPGVGNYLAMFSGSAQNSGGGNLFASLYVNGTQLTDTERQNNTGGSNNSTVAIQKLLIDIVGAGQAVEVRWRVSAGTGTFHQRILTLVRLS